MSNLSRRSACTTKIVCEGRKRIYSSFHGYCRTGESYKNIRTWYRCHRLFNAVRRIGGSRGTDHAGRRRLAWCGHYIAHFYTAATSSVFACATRTESRRRYAGKTVPAFGGPDLKMESDRYDIKPTSNRHQTGQFSSAFEDEKTLHLCIHTHA